MVIDENMSFCDVGIVLGETYMATTKQRKFKKSSDKKVEELITILYIFLSLLLSRLEAHFSSDSWLTNLGIVDIKSAIRYKMLQWYGNVCGNEGCIRQVVDMKLEW